MFMKRYFALFPDLGTAKTFMMLREFLCMWQAGLVDALLVVAPIDVHRQWIDEELPAMTDVECVTTVWPERPSLEQDSRPRIFTIYPEAFRRTKSVFELCKKYMRSARVGLVIDESQMIMNAGSKTSKRIRALKPYSHYRRCGSGFPAPKGLIDYYAQYSFLSTQILKCKTKQQFMDKFCVLGGFRGKQIVGYKNEDEFNKLVAPYTYTVRLDECKDMPARTWLPEPGTSNSPFHVELTPEQERLITQIKKEFKATLGGSTINMPMALQRLTRIQQIACGFLPKLDDKNRVIGLRWIPELRTKALENVLDSTRGKVIIWSRFKPCINRLTKHFGDTAVCYQGGMTSAEKREAKEAFQRDPKITRLFAQPKSANAGFNGLTVSRYSLFWSNDHNRGIRRQIERRTWRLGQSKACVYGDFIAKGTFDMKIRDALISGQNVADGILSDIAGWRTEQSAPWASLIA